MPDLGAVGIIGGLKLAPPPHADVSREDGAVIWIQDGLIFDVITVARVEVRHVEAIHRGTFALQGDAGSMPMLVDIRNVRWASAEARALGSKEAMDFRTTALAMLVGSAVSRMVGSLFLRMSPPPFPTRLFDDRDEALTWLKNQQVAEPP